MTIRRQGHDVAEAQDLTQEFFARLFEEICSTRLEEQQGKFRSSSLAFVKYSLSEQRETAGAQKRGRDHKLLSADASKGEAGYISEPVE